MIYKIENFKKLDLKNPINVYTIGRDLRNKIILNCLNSELLINDYIKTSLNIEKCNIQDLLIFQNYLNDNDVRLQIRYYANEFKHVNNYRKLNCVLFLYKHWSDCSWTSKFSYVFRQFHIVSSDKTYDTIKKRVNFEIQKCIK